MLSRASYASGITTNIIAVNRFSASSNDKNNAIAKITDDAAPNNQLNYRIMLMTLPDWNDWLSMVPIGQGR